MAVVSQSTPDLFYEKTYSATTKYYDGYDNVNKGKNAAYRSGSDGPIIDPIMTPWSHGGGWVTIVMALRSQGTIYLRVSLYSYPINHIKDVP